MRTRRILVSAIGVGSLLVTGYFISNRDANTLLAQGAAKAGNPITGEGLPNPAPKVIRNWGELPAGRKWGTSAGLGRRSEGRQHLGLRALRRGGTAGGGPVDCDNNPVDPVFKFDRHTGKVLANIGKGVMVTPHGISRRQGTGNVWIADFASNKAGTKGHQVHKFSPKGDKLLSLGVAGKPGNADGQFNQPNDVVVGPDGSIYVSDGHDAQGMTTQPGDRRGTEARRDVAHQQVHGRREVHQVVGHDRRASTASSARRTR